MLRELRAMAVKCLSLHCTPGTHLIRRLAHRGISISSRIRAVQILTELELDDTLYLEVRAAPCHDVRTRAVALHIVVPASNCV